MPKYPVTHTPPGDYGVRQTPRPSAGERSLRLPGTEAPASSGGVLSLALIRILLARMLGSGYRVVHDQKASLQEALLIYNPYQIQPVAYVIRGYSDPNVFFFMRDRREDGMRYLRNHRWEPLLQQYEEDAREIHAFLERDRP